MPNTKVTLTVFRDGKTQKLNLTVGTFPEDGVEEGSSETDVAMLDKLGLQVQGMTPEIAQQLGFEKPITGVVISDVSSGSLAEESGLQPGMVILEVNREEIKSVKEFEKAVRKAKGGNLLLRVKTQQGALFLNLQMDN